MRTIKVLSIIVLVLCSFTIAKSQTYNDLDERTQKLIALRAQEEVGQFTQYLQDIANKKLPKTDRYKYKDIALTLFVGGGKDYYEDILDVEGNKIDEVRKPAVTMEVTSLSKKTKNKRQMAKYLQGLADIKYKEVNIQTTAWHDMRVSEIRKTADGKYECVVYFEQVFISKGRDNTPGYIDRTKKRVTCYIDVVRTDDGLEILVQLGDVEATETTRI